jgi:hypothetical protein
LVNAAIFQRDLPPLCGTILVLALFFVMLNLAVARAAALDPASRAEPADASSTAVPLPRSPGLGDGVRLQRDPVAVGAGLRSAIVLVAIRPPRPQTLTGRALAACPPQRGFPLAPTSLAATCSRA